jgi:hypothetical protein
VRVAATAPPPPPPLRHSQGTAAKLHLFKWLLEHHPTWRERVVLLLVTVRSPSPAIADPTAEVTGVTGESVGKINGEYGQVRPVNGRGGGEGEFAVLPHPLRRPPDSHVRYHSVHGVWRTVRRGRQPQRQQQCGRSHNCEAVHCPPAPPPPPRVTHHRAITLMPPGQAAADWARVQFRNQCAALTPRTSRQRPSPSHPPPPPSSPSCARRQLGSHSAASGGPIFYYPAALPLPAPEVAGMMAAADVFLHTPLYDGCALPPIAYAVWRAATGGAAVVVGSEFGGVGGVLGGAVVVNPHNLKQGCEQLVAALDATPEEAVSRSWGWGGGKACARRCRLGSLTAV